jgi:hypothetical protein
MTKNIQKTISKILYISIVWLSYVGLCIVSYISKSNMLSFCTAMITISFLPIIITGAILSKDVEYNTINGL